MTEVNPIPDGYQQITPYLYVNGAAEAIEFYKAVFGAVERMRMPMDDGRVGHAELTIGESVFMISDEFLDIDVRGPKAVGGTPVTLSVYIPDVDTVFDRAVEAGAKAIRPVTTQFYGDRSGLFEDPFGHRWNVSTHVEDVPPEEMARRAGLPENAH